MIKKEIPRKVPYIIVAVLSMLFLAFYFTFTYSEYFITIFITFLIDGFILYLTVKMIPFEIPENTRHMYIMIMVLFCFSFTAISLSIIFQNMITPENSDDPLINSRKLLMDTYYTGTSKEWKYDINFREDETISVEQIIFNTTIPARQVEIHCFNTLELTCFHNSVHSWKNTSARLTVNCQILPCSIIYRELKNNE